MKTLFIIQLYITADEVMLWLNSIDVRWLLGVLAIVALVVFLMAVRPERKLLKHQRYIKKAERILRTLNEGGLSEGQVIGYLRKINPYVFEELILMAFRAKGFEFKRNKRYSGDGGVDGRVYRDGKEYLIQCKRYTNHIKAVDVEVFSNLCRRKGRRGFFIHTGRTGKDAWKRAGECSFVEIISGDRLVKLIKDNS